MSLPVSAPDRCGTATSVEDAALVERAQAGDRDAFGALHERYVDEVRAFLRRRVRLYDRQDVDDIAGDIWLTAWQALPKFANDGRPFRAWLFTIANHKVLRYYERARFRRHRSLDGTDELFDADRSGDQVADPSPATADQAIARAELVRVVAAIAELPPAPRMALLLMVRDGMRAQEIATRMDLAPSAVYVLVANARARLGMSTPHRCRPAPVAVDMVPSAAVTVPPPRQQLALRLHTQGMTYSEIAATMATSRNAVKHLLRLARWRLEGRDSVTGQLRMPVHSSHAKDPDPTAVAALPPRQRTAWRYRADGMSYADIADAMGITYGAVKMLLRLARHRLGVQPAGSGRPRKGLSDAA